MCIPNLSGELQPPPALPPMHARPSSVIIHHQRPSSIDIIAKLSSFPADLEYSYHLILPTRFVYHCTTTPKDS